ncbi:MAG TPA: SGNH hydrolase domain-containing protein, partial [Acidimicrobiales bacterium]|nr:SGNH hydrolase domain-containing protein [Acidimicrobiales bacterium]
MRGTRAARAAPPVTGPVRAVHTTVVAVIAVVAVLAASGCGSVERAPLRSSVVLAELPPLGRVHAEEPPRVLIFGDSIAAQHGNPAAFALRDAGVDAEVFALWGHGLFTREQYDIGAPRPDPPALSLMAAASAEVADFDPDVVAVYINHNYWPPYPRDAAGAVIARGSPAFAAMAGTQITELVHRLSAGGATIYLIEPAPEGPGATAADNPVWAGYLAARDDLGFQVIDSGDAVADAEGAWVADLPDCTGSPVRVRPPGDLHLTYFGAGLMGTRTANALAEAVDWPISDLRAPSQAPAAMLPMGTGYRLVTCDGGTFHFGVGGSALGALPPEDSLGVGESVVGAATALDGDGAWLLTSAGRVRGLAGAPHLGDAELARGDRAVAITPTPTGAGYWVATASGAVQAFGDAEKLGDLAGSADPVVAITATADGDGYWLATAGGRVAAFGAAP